MSVIAFSITERLVFQRIGSLVDMVGAEAYVVGGFVRDKLLGIVCKDIDIVCIGISAITLANQYILSFAPHAPFHYFKTYGVARIEVEGYSIEFVNARKESYVSHSRNPTVTTGTFLEDQARRDFTINTLAASLNAINFGTIIDTFGGLRDLKEQILRTPLDPDITFSDDPLRIFRAVRFATCLRFSLHKDTLSAMKRNADRINILSQERISEELHKIIGTSQPSSGFLHLYEVGVLSQILPELTQLKGIEYRDQKGHKDNFYHSLTVLDNIAPATDKLWLRWAALLHDIGKSYTKKFYPQTGWTFHMHEIVGAKMVRKIFQRLKFPLGDPLSYVQKIILLHHRPISLTKENITDAAIRRLLFDAGEEMDDLMTLCYADITSKNQRKVAQYKANFKEVERRSQEVEAKDQIRNFQPPISGALIMETFQLPPCKKVGLIKDHIKDAILDAHIPNTPEAALAYMHKIAPAILALPS